MDSTVTTACRQAEVDKTPNRPLSLRTGYHWDERYNFHDTGTAARTQPSSFWPSQGLLVQPFQHAESAVSKSRIHSLLAVSGILDHCTMICGRRASRESLLLFHDPCYLERLEKMSNSDSGGEAGECTPVGRGSFDVACFAVGGCLAAVDAICSGEIDNAYCLVRPPGHHAERDRGMGFCLLNNISISANYAIKHYELKRIAIIDWDVHHGNGTAKGFYSRDNVLFISIHQKNLYPENSGQEDEMGDGLGKGKTINIPLPPGCGRGAYDYAMETIVIPQVKQFQPDMILVSCGFDAGAMDPLGRMMLSSSDYGRMTSQMVALASEICNGKLLLCHEGGYNPAQTPFCGLAVVEALANRVTNVIDPFDEEISKYGFQDLQSHQRALVDSIVVSIAKYT
eukprot:CFRG6649T1